MENISYLDKKNVPEIYRPTTETDVELNSAKLADLGAGEHLIGAFVGKSSGPTLIVIGGLHGNEPGGAIALSNVSMLLGGMAEKLKGRVYFLRGNTRALSQGVRFLDADLNRHWTPENLSNIGSEMLSVTSEGVELAELDRILDSILITAMDEVFVLDLHSTSSDGRPFATVGDTLRNREFAQKFPFWILLGIEEQLDGTMLEYLNNAGAVTLGFEGGQHISAETVKNHEAITWLALVNSGVLSETDLADQGLYRGQLDAGRGGSSIVEVRLRKEISDGDEFEMNQGFNNFDPISKGQVLAKNKYGNILAGESGLILMPLYQKLGDDGFFIGRVISPFWLLLSGILRRIGIQRLIHLVPGVRRDPDDTGKLIVNTNIARFFPLQVFHLLGFRRHRWVGNKLIVSRRRHDTSGPFKWKG